MLGTSDVGNVPLLRVFTGRDSGKYFVAERLDSWRPGEWHHLILSWDAARGYLVAYVDGRERAVLGKNFHDKSWKAGGAARLVLGTDPTAGTEAWPGTIERVQVFDHSLSREEARAEFLRYGRFQLQVRTLDAFLFAGRDERCRLVFDNASAAPVTVAPQFRLLDAAGTVVQSGALEAITVPPEGTARTAVNLRLPSSGEYTLAVHFLESGHAETRPLSVMAIAPHEEIRTGNQPPREITSVDATARPVAESAPSHVVHSQLGDYREAGMKKNDRFAVGFEVQDIGAPHLATIAYPDDKPRTMEMVLQRLDPPGDLRDYQAQTGVFTGGEYPSSNQLEEHRVLFWPTTPRMAFIFMTAEDGHPVAVSRIRISKLEGGLAKLAVQAYAGSVPARHIGLYYEDPVLNKSFSMSPLFPGFGRAVDTLLDYMQWFGQDTLHYPVAWYRGPIYGSEVEPLEGDLSRRPHPYDYPRYLMKRLEARGLTFNGGLHIHDLGSLLPHVVLDEERVLSGEETPINMQANNHLLATDRHHVDSNYNPLDPHVQTAVKNLVAEIADRYGDERAFTGLTLVLPRHKLFAFGSLKSGYNDVNLRRFQQETGIAIPLNPKDRQRFSKSYAWLMRNAKKEWIAWRCRRIHDYFKELADILSTKRGDLKLTVNLFARPELYHERLAHYVDSPDILAETFSEAGVDPRLFAGDHNIVFSYTMVPADLRFLRSGKDHATSVEAHRTAYFAPEVTRGLRDLPGGAWAKFHDRYFEDAIGRTQPLAGLGVQEVKWRVSTLNPGSVHALEPYVLALNNVDALDITKGGFVIGTLGTEDVVGKFAQAYRALPAVRFDDVEGLTDPVRVRQQVVDGRARFYVLNTLPIPAEVTLNLRGEPALRLDLQPYELRTFHRDSPTPVVTGGHASVDTSFIERLTVQLTDAEKRAAGVAEARPYLEFVRECARQRHYSRLFRLLQESWNRAVQTQPGKAETKT